MTAKRGLKERLRRSVIFISRHYTLMVSLSQHFQSCLGGLFFDDFPAAFKEVFSNDGLLGTAYRDKYQSYGFIFAATTGAGNAGYTKTIISFKDFTHTLGHGRSHL